MINNLEQPTIVYGKIVKNSQQYISNDKITKNNLK